MRLQHAVWNSTRVVCFLLIAISAGQLLSRCSAFRMELAGVKFSSLEDSTRQQLAGLQDTLFVTYYTSAPARMPSHMRGIEPSVKALLESMKAAAQEKFNFRIIDPDSNPDLAGYAARRGVAPFRARSVSRDSHSEQSVWSALTLEYGTRDPAVIHAIGPEHISRLQRLLVAHIQQLKSPWQPSFALAAPPGFSDLRDALARRGTVVEVDLDGGDPIPEDAEILFWMEPASMEPRRLREIDRFLARGHSVVLAAGRQTPVVQEHAGAVKVQFQLREYAAEALLRDLGLEPLKKIVLDAQSQALALDRGTIPAPFLIRCLPYEQNFHALRGQPNGPLLFSAPTPIALNSDRLSDRGLGAEILATTSQSTWIQELPEGPVELQDLQSDRGEPAPKLPLMVLLRPRDPWRGLFLAGASSGPFADGLLENAHFAHGRLLGILVDNLASAERLVYGRLGEVEPAPLPELNSSSRIFWQSVCIFFFPILLVPGGIGSGGHAFLAGRLNIRTILLAAWVPVGLAAVVLLAWAGGKFDYRLDLTREGVNTFAPETWQILQNAATAGSVEAELIISDENRLPPEMRPWLKRLRERLSALQRVENRFSLRELNPDLEPSGRAGLAAQGIEPARITVRRDGVTTMTRFYCALVLSSGGERVILTFPDTSSFENLEFRLAFALWRLGSRRQSHIGFAADVPRLTPAEAHENYQLKGLFAPGGSDVYSTARSILEANDFRITHINPQKPVLPPDLDLLVWLQPRRPAVPMLEAIVHYLHSGGRVLLAAQHFNMQSRQYQGTNFGTIYWPQPQWPELEDLYFPEIGIRLVREILFDQLKTDIVVESQIHAGGEIQFESMPSTLPFLIRASATNFSRDSLMTRGLGDQAFIWASYLDWDERLLQQNGIRARPLIQTSERTWSYAWTGGWIPDELLTGPPDDRDGSIAWLGRKALAVLFEGTFPLPKEPLSDPEDFPGSGESPSDLLPAGERRAPAKLLFISCSEVFKNQWIRQPDFRGDHLLLNGVAALALPADLASIMARRPVSRGFDYIEPQQRLLWRLAVIAAVPTGYLLVLVPLYRRRRRSPAAKIQTSPAPASGSARAGGRSWRWILPAGALVALNWGMSYHDVIQRSNPENLGRLIPQPIRENLRLAIIRVRSGDGKIHLYGRDQGVWRCLSYAQAPLDQAAIESLVRKIIEAEGFVKVSNPSAAESYGFDTPQTVTIWLHGPDFFKDRLTQDLQIWLQIGRSASDREGCYVRLGGSRAVWLVDRDPSTELLPTSGRSDLPPMLDRSIFPGVNATAGPLKLQQILIQPPNGDPYELVIQRNTSPEGPSGPQPPFEWVIKRGGSIGRCRQERAFAYAEFLVQAPWLEVIDPELKGSFGFENPRGHLAVVSPGGETHQLVAGATQINAGVSVLNQRFQTAYLISEEVYGLLFPPAGLFQESGKDNPWEPWLDQPGWSPVENGLPSANFLLQQMQQQGQFW